ncbi:MAG: hypothetical protein LBK94_10360 [Prevotellaceae bacterium]|jgi:hypothetical protein|nr:hypothetical protein [Prevotellaceae bacterium]
MLNPYLLPFAPHPHCENLLDIYPHAIRIVETFSILVRMKSALWKLSQYLSACNPHCKNIADYGLQTFCIVENFQIIIFKVSTLWKISLNAFI